jgi:hypothetical protein
MDLVLAIPIDNHEICKMGAESLCMGLKVYEAATTNQAFSLTAGRTL